MSPLVVFVTAPSHDEALRIARTLVEAQLAACCTIAREVTSIYRWNGAVEEATEVLVIVKTTAERFDALRKRILEIHPYDVPELIALPIVEGSPDYLRWLAESVDVRQV